MARMGVDRFVTRVGNHGVSELIAWDVEFKKAKVLLALGPPSGWDLCKIVQRRLNAAPLAIQAIELEGPHALDTLALKFLYEAHNERTDI